jgi:RNA-directed DNA polymerase
MGSKRQNNQLELAFGEAVRSEAPNRLARGTEDPVARPAAEGSAAAPGFTGGLMEAIVARDNLKKALAQVKRNKGAPGIDGMTVAELTPYLKEHWPAIRAQLLDGTYRPQPVRRVEIPKPAGGMRALGIPTVLDRFIQQAVLQVLQSQWDATFSPSSYGFRPGRSAHQAVARAQELIAAGRRWVVDIDLEKFFDRVNHDLLMGLVAERVADKLVRKLIRGYLTAGVLADGLVGPTDEGTPQGGPLSPLLSNLMLDGLDKELERRGHCFVRYADDCNIYVHSRRAGERVMASVERFLTCRLKLKVNTAKSAVAPPEARKFLGFSFTRDAEPRRRIAPQAGPVYQLGAGADAAHGGREPAPSHRPAVDLSDGLARLFRVLSDARTAAKSGGMGATAVALSCLGAMAHRQATLHRAAPIRDRALACGHYHSGGAPARPLASQSASGPPSRSVQRLLRRQWSAHPGPGRRMTPPPNRRVRTRTHGGVGGEEP